MPATLHQVTTKPEEIVGLTITKQEGILWEIMYFVYSRYHIQMTAVCLRSDKYGNLLVPIKNTTLFLCVTARCTVNPKYLTPWCRLLPGKAKMFQLVEILHIIVNDDKQDATISVYLFIPSQLYTFRAMSSPIIRST